MRSKTTTIEIGDCQIGREMVTETPTRKVTTCEDNCFAAAACTLIPVILCSSDEIHFIAPYYKRYAQRDSEHSTTPHTTYYRVAADRSKKWSFLRCVRTRERPGASALVRGAIEPSYDRRSRPNANKHIAHDAAAVQRWCSCAVAQKVAVHRT